MRHVCPAAVAAFAYALFAPGLAVGQSGGAGLSITNYRLVSEVRSTRTQWFVSYRADLLNTGAARAGVTATVTSLVPTIQVVPGQGVLHFAPVPANSTVTSVDTFTILVDRSVPFDPANLAWFFLNPVANAGGDQTARVGATAVLNGAGSSNPSGQGTLSYQWKIESSPTGSQATLANAKTAIASFVVDAPGAYVISLTVDNGSGSDKAVATISTVNSPPVANAGPNQTISVNSTAQLNGSGSYDVDGDPLSYFWRLISRPAESATDLANLRSVSPSLYIDKPGKYIVQLIVNDGTADSASATVTIATSNTPPVANAGQSQTVSLGALVQLNGSGSTDVDGDTLTFHWSMITAPTGSAAALNSATAVAPTFTADKPGNYVAQLIVNDGQVDSTPSMVTITTNATQPPVAHPGPNQTVVHGSIVQLHGSGTDPQLLPLTYSWSLISRPAGSTAVLSSTTDANPTFVVDLPGTYVCQLTVANQYVQSTPATVTITTTNTPPVADAGQNSSVFTGALVALDGGNSKDADNDPLTYSWSFLTRPAGSTTALQAPNSKTPSFYADISGTYVIQLIVNDGFINSNPATVAITAGTAGISITPNAIQLYNAPATLTIGIAAPAGVGGVKVSLSSFDPSIISLPSSVTIPEGSTGANVVVTPIAPGATTILASAPGYQPASATATVSAPAITLTSATAVGLTRSIDGTITLNAPAPPGGIQVALAASPVGPVSFDAANISIAAGQTTGTFKILGVTEGSVTITASSPGYVSGTVSILVVKLGTIALSQNLTVGPGKSEVLDVRLSLPAPPGGVTITLTSSDTSVLTVPATVSISQGATAPATPAQVTGIAFGSATVTASAPGYTGDTQTVKVGASLSFSTQTVTVGAGGVQTPTVLLSAPAPAGGLTISLTSGKPSVATVPATVTIAAGATSAPVPVTGVAVGFTTITASSAAPNVTGASLNVNVADFGGITLPAIGSLPVGQTAPFPVTLSAAAPAGGVTVTLSTTNSGIVDITPKSVTIAAGQTQPASQPVLTAAGLGSATITASAPGFGSANQSVQTTAALSFAPATVTLTVADSKSVTLNLSAAAPAGGIAITLTAAPAGIVQFPGTVTIPQNATSISVSFTGAASGSATITAAAGISGVSNATANITVVSAGSVILPASLTLAPGQTAPLAVSLSSAAPKGGVAVSLTSGDPATVAIVPTSITIPEGKTQPDTLPQATGINFGSTTITASAPGFVPDTKPVTVGGSLSISPQTTTIAGTETKNLTITLSAPAPSDLPLTIGASPAGLVTIPSTVTIAKNSATATISATGAAAGTTTITVSSSIPTVTSATTTITVQSAGTIVMSSGSTIGLGQSAALQITLPAPAPAGGVTVTLSSSAPSKVSVSPTTVQIAAGQTQPSIPPQVTGADLGTADITAAAPLYTSAVKSVQVTANISLSPQNLSLFGKETRNLTLTLSGPAPAGGMTFSISSSNTAIATVGSPTVTIPANAKTADIPVTGVATGSAAIRASAPNVADASATVTVAPAIDIVMPASLSLAQGETASLFVGLSAPYASNVSIDLTSSDPSKATVSPSTITILAGQTTSTTAVRVTGGTTGAATITARATNANLPSASTSVAVSAFRVTLSPQNMTIMGTGNTATLFLSLSAPAPDAGITFTLTSSSPSVASVIPTVTMSATTTSIGVRVTSNGIGSAVIRVNAPQLPEATATVTVVGPGAITLSAPATIGLSQSGPLTVALSTPAPIGGVTVDLSSSDTSRVTVSPASVLIPEGATTPAAAPQLLGVNVGSATIQATAPGYVAAVPVTVNVNATVTWISQDVTIVGLNVQYFLALRLNAAAPQTWQDGVHVNLSSTDPAVATVQATGIFIWDGSTAPGILIPVTSVSPGTVQIKASGVNIPEVATTVTVVGQLSIATGTPLPDATTGTPYSTTITASGGRSPLSWSATGLPPDLAIDPATGVISGTPTAAGAITFEVTVTDSATPTFQTVKKTFTLTVTAAPALRITTASLPTGSPGVPYSFTMAATGGAGALTWSATGLPGGLTMSAAGVISGSPTGPAGTSSVVVTAKDSGTPQQIDTRTLNLTIDPPALRITTTALTDGVVGAAYTFTMSAIGGAGALTWSATGLPGGLTMSAAGVISGTPTGPSGAGSVVLTVKDSGTPQQTDTKTLTLTIAPAALHITTAALTDGTIGSAYSLSLTAAGGTGNLTWSATGLPAGLTMNAAGAISGTPTGPAGTSSVVVTVKDSGTPQQTDTKTLNLKINPAALTCTTTSLTGGTVGVAYTFALTCTGGMPPLTWSATGLPAGLTLSAGGVITGTPTGPAGTSSVVVTVKDSGTPQQTQTLTLPLTIAPPVLRVTTTALTDGMVGAAYSFTMAATGGTGALTWSATGLPAGLTMNAAGAISGTPTGPAGTSSVVVTVNDSGTPQQTDTKTLSLTIAAPGLHITTAALTDGRVGAAYSLTMAATGGAGAYTWSATGLPAGLTINTAGAISGTPTGPAGTSSVVLTVKDSGTPQQTDTKTLSLTVTPPLLHITTAALTDGTVGTAYSLTMAATGGTGAYTWSATGLPAGLTLSAAGAISGTPAGPAGTSSVVLTVKDAGTPQQTDIRTLTLTILPAALRITTAALTNGTVGTAYSLSMAATGGTGAYTWSATGLPAGLTMNAAGAISGTPTGPAGTSNVIVTVKDSGAPQQTDTKTLGLTIAPPALRITTAALADGMVGAVYNLTMAATGGTGAYTWSATGLPAGLTLNAAGAISGNPIGPAGTASVVLTVKDSGTPQQTDTKTLTLTITPPVLRITTTALTDGTVGAAYSFTMTAAGGSGALTWSATGLPSGLTMSAAGVISGPPTGPAGTSSVTFTVKDSGTPQQTDTKTLNLTIIPPVLHITTSTLPNAVAGTAYSFTASAGGGTGTYTWSATGLPTGLTINPATGVISGTTTAAGPYSVAITVKDSGTPQQTDSKTLNLTVSALPPTIATVSLPGGVVGRSYSATVTATGGTGALTWSAAGLPAGLSMSAAGVISGTPAGPAGTSSVMITVKDSGTPQQSDSKALSLLIANPALTITTAALPNGSVNTPYPNTQLTATGGTGTYTWTVTGLPSGLTATQAGLISGMSSPAGSYLVTIAATDGQQTDTKQLTLNIAIPPGTITVTDANVGQNLQTGITITITPPPTIDVNLTITSDNPNVLLGSADVAGSATLTATVSAGNGSVGTLVKSLAASGTAHITAKIAGYADGVGTVTLSPSAFVLSSPNGIGAAFDAYQGSQTQLTVYAARIGANNTFAETQPIRGTYTVNVPVLVAPSSSGTVSPTSIPFGGGQISAPFTFTATANTGVAVINLSEPFPFVTPNSGASLQANLKTSGILGCTPTPPTIGKNLQTTWCLQLTAPALSGPVPITVTSATPGKLQFSASPSGPPQDSIVVTVPNFQRFTPDFYVHGYDSAGSVSYVATAAGYGSNTLPVNLAPSGFVITTPFGVGVDFTTSLGGADPNLVISTARIDPATSAPVETQPLSSKIASLQVGVASTSASVGTVVTSPVVIPGGSGTALTAFHPVGEGVATITASAAGWQSASVQATVQKPRLVVTGGTVGQFLQDIGQVIVPGGAPAGGLRLTIQSNSALLNLSADPLKAGAGAINIDLNAGQSVATFYLQPLGSSGTATFTASAPGFTSNSGNVDMTPSGIVILGPFGCSPCTVVQSAGPQQVTVLTAQLDASQTPIAPQSLAGGQPLSVTLASNNRGIGTVDGSVVMMPNSYTATATFTPVAPGSVTLSITQPPGWSTPVSLASLLISVN